MFRRTAWSCCVAKQKQLRDVVARLDSFEKEVVSLKAFRTAVESVSPEVAKAANQIAKERQEMVHKDVIDMDNPLTPDEFGELYQLYAQKPRRPVKLAHLMNINNEQDLLNHAKIAHREFSVRVAKRAAGLNNAPLGLGRMPAIEDLRKLYEWSFHDIRSVNVPTDRATATQLDRLVRRVYLRHLSSGRLMLRGLRQLTTREGITRQLLLANDKFYSAYKPIQETFENFVETRERVRFLLGNYMYLSTRLLDLHCPDKVQNALCAPRNYGHDDGVFSGMICRKTSMVRLVDHAKQDAVMKFPEIERCDDDFPKITVRVVGDPELTFVGIPQNIVQILSSMIEAAIRSNLRRSDERAIAPTPVHVTIAQQPGASDISVRVSDSAGGMPFSEVPMSLEYLYSCDVDDPRLVKLSYAAILAKTFGGEMQVFSIDGYGTDRVLYTPAGKTLLEMSI